MAPDGFRDGFDPQRERLHTVAAIIDRPSLYMGGPSRQSIAKAREILAALDALPSSLPVDVAFVALDPDFRAAPTDAVEAVARAIYEAKHKGLKNCYEWDDCRLDDEHPGAREGYERDARAALAAMPAPKEPSQ